VSSAGDYNEARTVITTGYPRRSIGVAMGGTERE